MADLLATTSGDLDFSSGDLRLVTGADELGQRLRQRLKIFQGEWFLDARQGMPYFQEILGAKPRTPVVTALFRQAVTSTPGVQEIRNLTVEYDGATRQLDVDFVVVSTSGEPVEVNVEFII